MKHLLVGLVLIVLGIPGALAGGSTGQLAVVSAASYTSPVAPDSVVSIFGANLAAATAVAPDPPPNPLPTSLGGVSAVVTDNVGTQAPLPLAAVSTGQVNAVLPAGLRPGPATLTLTTASGPTLTGHFTLATVAPALFTANQSGAGVAAAQVFHVHADGSTTIDAAIAQCPGGAGSCVPVPIDLGPPTDQVYLILYATGIRHHTPSLADVSVTVGGAVLPALYAGSQMFYFGLDQINVQLPQSLAGAGEVSVNVVVDGAAANTVSIALR